MGRLFVRVLFVRLFVCKIMKVCFYVHVRVNLYINVFICIESNALKLFTEVQNNHFKPTLRRTTLISAAKPGSQLYTNRGSAKCINSYRPSRIYHTSPRDGFASDSSETENFPADKERRYDTRAVKPKELNQVCASRNKDRKENGGRGQLAHIHCGTTFVSGTTMSPD